jgi:hypothetical protein
MNLGAFHQAYSNKKATEFAIKNFRKFHPNNPYFLYSDNGLDFSDIAKKYNCNYEFCEERIGYDKCFGFGIDGSFKWLERFYRACLAVDCEYIIMMEDDILIQNYIKFPENIEVSGHNSFSNKIPKEFLDYLSQKYSVKFLDDWYGSGGGTIFKVVTFIENYDRIIQIFQEELANAISQKTNGNMGWVDNFMTLYYLLCGKKQTPNPFLTEITKNPNWNDKNFSIVHQYKEYYE